MTGGGNEVDRKNRFQVEWIVPNIIVTETWAWETETVCQQRNMGPKVWASFFTHFIFVLYFFSFFTVFLTQIVHCIPLHKYSLRSIDNYIICTYLSKGLVCMQTYNAQTLYYKNKEQIVATFVGLWHICRQITLSFQPFFSPNILLKEGKTT